MASQDSPGDGGVSRALPKLFLQGWEARRKLDACELSSGSPEHSVTCICRRFITSLRGLLNIEMCV